MAIGEPFASQAKIPAVVGYHHFQVQIDGATFNANTNARVMRVPFDCQAVKLGIQTNSDLNNGTSLFCNVGNNVGDTSVPLVGATALNMHLDGSTTPAGVQTYAMTNATLTKGQYLRFYAVADGNEGTGNLTFTLVVRSQQNSDNTVTDPL